MQRYAFEYATMQQKESGEWVKYAEAETFAEERFVQGMGVGEQNSKALISEAVREAVQQKREEIIALFAGIRRGNIPAYHLEKLTDHQEWV